MQGFSVDGMDRLFVSGKKPIFKQINNRGKKNHGVTSQCSSKELTGLLMAWRALFSVFEVRWVYLEVVRTLTWPRIFCSSMRSTPASSKWVA